MSTKAGAFLVCFVASLLMELLADLAQLALHVGSLAIAMTRRRKCIIQNSPMNLGLYLP
jgi:hypothetical protein